MQNFNSLPLGSSGRKRKVFVLCDYFFPGYRAGGPIKSLRNLIEALSSEFVFYVFTRDRDIGEGSSYSQRGLVSDGVWTDVGLAKVFYASPSLFSLTLIRELRRGQYDLVYLNSFFSPWQTVRYLVYRRLGIIRKGPVLLAPRGEFADGALGLKKLKKKLYLAIGCRILLPKSLLIYWHASTGYEAKDIGKIKFLHGKIMRAGNCMCVAPDIASVPGRDKSSSFTSGGDGAVTVTKKPGQLRVVFLSRICEVKNLSLALKIVSSLSCEVVFDIYGPVEDQGYWDLCQQQITKAPANIRIEYRGFVLPDAVPSTLAAYHVFLLPTMGENYGHVIVEALMCGRPVIISNTTPWRDLAEHNAGADCDLEDDRTFVAALNRYANMGPEAFIESSLCARRYAEMKCKTDEVIAANREMLLSVMRDST
jgi:glycosyltransferase involved in cell wall biosynthesis